MSPALQGPQLIISDLLIDQLEMRVENIASLSPLRHLDVEISMPLSLPFLASESEAELSRAQQDNGAILGLSTRRGGFGTRVFKKAAS